MAILLVRVQAPAEGKSDETYLELAHVKKNNSLLQHVQQLAWDLLPGASQIHATYTDDEGDRCTLTEQTAKDAITFASPHKEIEDTVVLNVVIRVEWPEAAAVESQTPPPMMEAEGAPQLPVEAISEPAGYPGGETQPDIEQSAPEACETASPMQPDIEQSAPGACETASPVLSEAASSQPDPAEVEKLIQPPPVIRRVFQRDSAKKRPASEQEPSTLTHSAPDSPATSPQVAMRQPEESDSQLQSLRQQMEHATLRIEQASCEVEAARQEAVEAKLHAKAVEEQAEEDAKLHIEESMKYMQEAEEARRIARESENARQLSDEATLQAHEFNAEQALHIDGLQRTLADVQAARKEAEEAQQQALTLQVQSLEEEISHRMGAEYEAAKQTLEEAERRAEKLAADVHKLQQTLDEARNARKDHEEASHCALDCLQQQLEGERRAAEEGEEMKREAESRALRLEDEVHDLKNMLNDALEEKNATKDTLKEVEEMQQEAESRAECLADEIFILEGKLKEAEATTQRVQEVADSLLEELTAETDAKSEALSAAQRAQEDVDSLRQILETETDAKMEAVSAAQRAQEDAVCLRETLETETNAKTKTEVEKAKAVELAEAKAVQKAQAFELAVGLQKGLADETAARKEAEKSTKVVLGELQKARQDIETLNRELLKATERAANAEELASDMQRSEANMPRYSASVHMIEDCPLTLGIEAEEDAAARGDVTKELADLAASYGAQQAFRIGRIRLPASFSEVAPACARVAVKNTGAERWPQTTVIVHVEGDNFGLQVMALGVLEPGAVKEIEMDLAVNSKTEGQVTVPGHSQSRIYRPRHTMPQLAPRKLSEAREEVRSVWAIVDAATGARLGPLLVFEAAWNLP